MWFKRYRAVQALKLISILMTYWKSLLWCTMIEIWSRINFSSLTKLVLETNASKSSSTCILSEVFGNCNRCHNFTTGEFIRISSVWRCCQKHLCGVLLDILGHFLLFRANTVQMIWNFQRSCFLMSCIRYVKIVIIW